MEKNKKGIMPIKIYLIAICLILPYFLPHEAIAQEEEGITIADLKDAQKVAEEFLGLVEAKDYKKMKKMWHMPVEYNQSRIEEEEESINEVMEIYSEVLGTLKKYSYKSYEWQDAQLWSSGKIDPAELILTYKSEYTKYPIDTRVTIVKDGDNFKVGSYGISSPISVDDIEIYMEINEKVQNLIKVKKGLDRE